MPQTPRARRPKALSRAAQAALEGLRKALPTDEFEAVRCWATTFFPFQLEWVLDFGRFSILVKSRRIGGSHSYAAAVALWALLGEETTIVSKTGADSDEVRDKVTGHLKVLCRLGSIWAKPLDPREGYCKKIQTLSGGIVRATSSEAAGRGFSGNIVLDEFAYHQHAQDVLDAALPVVFHAGKFRMLSTPNGVGNQFHKMVSEPEARPGYRVFATTLEQARAEGMKVSDADVESMTLGDPRLYEQLFNCGFLDGSEQYIPTEVIKDSYRAIVAPTHGARRYAGLDLGRRNDLTALVIVEQDRNNVVRVIDTITMKRTEWEKQQSTIIDWCSKRNVVRLCVDETGLGMIPTELLQAKLGRHRVEACYFTAEFKEELATSLYQAFNDHMIEMREDADMTRDLCAIRRVITTAGNVRYDAERTDAGHADRAWALALAIHAVSTQPGERSTWGG